MKSYIKPEVNSRGKESSSDIFLFTQERELTSEQSNGCTKVQLGTKGLLLGLLTEIQGRDPYRGRDDPKQQPHC